MNVWYIVYTLFPIKLRSPTFSRMGIRTPDLSTGANALTTSHRTTYSIIFTNFISSKNKISLLYIYKYIYKIYACTALT